MGKYLGFLLVLGMGFQSAFAGVQNCEKLARDLRDMTKAQHQILDSFHQNNRAMVMTLEQHSEGFKKSLKKRGRVPKSQVEKLNISAQLLRAHDESAQKLTARFEKASAALMDKVQFCLSHNESQIVSGN